MTIGEHSMDAPTLLDRLTIRQLVEDWAVLRDARLWDRFCEVWHEDGRMMATWFQGSRDEVIKVSEEGYQKGVRILHFLGGSTIDLSGSRAIAQTKMTISQRAKVDGVLCDVVCTGRFYDFFEKSGRWGCGGGGVPGAFLFFLKRGGRGGSGAAPADLREGSPRSARSVGEARTRF